jgi:hypothetical protein
MTNCTPPTQDVNADECTFTQETAERCEAWALRVLRGRFPGKQVRPVSTDRHRLEWLGYRVDDDGIMRHGTTVISAGGWPAVA